MKRLFLFLIVIFLFSNICANCDEGQIDINSASAEELQELDGVGEKISQYIIDERQFNSVDELINVYRIGEVTLEKIKKQGLACIGEDKEGEEKKYESLEEKERELIEEKVEKKNKKMEIVTGEVINLGSQNIKSKGFFEKIDASDYAIYGFIGFSILLGLLFILKLKFRNKDEIE